MALARVLREGMEAPVICCQWLLERAGILNQAGGIGNLMWAAFVLVLFISLAADPATADENSEELRLLVQPRSWQPPGAGPGPGLLAAYLRRSTGIAIRVRESTDSLSHWRSVRGKSTYELILDEAQFTDYLIQQRHYTILAQSAQTMRFSLAVRPGTVFTDPADLSARRIAVPAPPSLAALRLLELFPRPASVPVIVEFRRVSAALQALEQGRVQAVLLPLIRLCPETLF